MPKCGSCAILLGVMLMKLVTAAVIIEEGKLLIARRGNGSDQEGLWELPGGKAEQGETLQECLRRELHEELGIIARIGDEIMRVDIPGRNGRMALVALRADIVDGKPEAIEHSEIAWIKRDELAHYEFCPADRLMLDELGRLMEKGECR